MAIRLALLKSLTLLILLSTTQAQAQAPRLSQEQIKSKENGIALYNQYKDPEQELRVAAEAGDKEAQYYLAEDLRRTNRYTTEEAYKWYTRASEQGDLYAMHRLSSMKSDLCVAMGNCPKGLKSANDWHKKLLSTATELAEKGDGEAMYLLYHATNNLEWLENLPQSAMRIVNFGWHQNTHKEINSFCSHGKRMPQ